MKLILATVFLLLAGNFNSYGQVAVIANKTVPMDELNRTQLIDFYTYDIKKWSDGRPVIVTDLKPKNETKTVFYEYLGKSTSRMKSIWLKMMLSGEGDPPQSIASEEEMVQKVAATPGALGFVNAAKANDSVKTLLVINPEKIEQ